MLGWYDAILISVHLWLELFGINQRKAGHKMPCAFYTAKEPEFDKVEEACRISGLPRKLYGCRKPALKDCGFISTIFASDH